jgi:hypothetical protein
MRKSITSDTSVDLEAVRAELIAELRRRKNERRSDEPEIDVPSMGQSPSEGISELWQLLDVLRFLE